MNSFICTFCSDTLFCFCNNEGLFCLSCNADIPAFGCYNHLCCPCILIICISDCIVIFTYSSITVFYCNFRCFFLSIVYSFTIGKCNGAVFEGCLFQGRNVFCVGSITVCTFKFSGSIFQIACFFGNSSFVPFMRCFICLISNIAVATSYTGISCKTFCCAGGICHFCFVTVSQYSTIIRNHYVITVLACISSIASLCTSWGCYDFFIIMACSFPITGSVGSATYTTGVFCVSFFNTGWWNYFLLVLVSCCSHIIISIGVATVLTTVISITTFCTGRSSHCFFVIMFQWFCPGIGVRIIAVFTLMQSITLHLAGCLYNRILIIMRCTWFIIFTFGTATELTGIKSISVSGAVWLDNFSFVILVS